MEEITVVMLKAMWGIIQAVYYLIRFIIQTIFFIRAKIPKSPEAYRFPEKARFEHTLVVGGSGHGKTQLLQHLFVCNDLNDVMAGRKSVVFIDSQGDMLQKILHLAELTPSRHEEAIQEQPQSATGEPQQKAPEKPPKERTGASRFWHIVGVLLVNLLVLAAFFIIAVFVQAIYWDGKEESITLGSILLGFGLLTGAWYLLIYPARILFRKSGAPGSSQVKVATQVVEQAKRPSLADRLVLIDPNDVENPPCLNLFDFGLDRIKDYSALDREKFINSAIALYEYMFGALLGAELSQRQGVIFRYLARLLMVVPNPTIYTLMDFMEEPERVREHLPKLDVQTQRFFVTQFFSHKFDDTRQQILTRLWGVLSNNVLARMFSHSHNKLNLFEADEPGEPHSHQYREGFAQTRRLRDLRPVYDYLH
jgi:predicted ATPase